MTSKKFKLFITGVGLLLSSATFAQQGGTYDVYDSTVIRKKDMPQQNEFWNNQYSFPAKPRNMWEVGISAGAFTILSDVPARFPTLGLSAHIRKALGYVFSVRLQYLYGNARGLSWIPSRNYGKNTAWNRYYNAPTRNAQGALVGTVTPGGAFEHIYFNYQTSVHDLGIQGIITLNNIRFHKQKSGLLIYGGIGIGGTLYNTNVNALDANNQPYTALFASLPGNVRYEDRKDIIDRLKDGMDDTYETPAEASGGRRPITGKYTMRMSSTALAGVAFKLGRRLNLAIEDRFTIVKDDLLDGQRWQEHATGDASLTPDYDTYNYGSVGLNFNLGAKSVEPLWWLNPLDYAYSELNNPRHMKLPKPVLDDTDGDGVIDQLDKEPNTPAGCPVDTHGVTLDRDGDGVPDCNDKQLITPTECQPVDADGVGKCPLPDCCTPGGGDTTNTACVMGDLPSISFRGNSDALSADARAMLATVAAKIKSNANCRIAIIGYASTNKQQQSRCRRRVEVIEKYLRETQGVTSDRMTVNCEIGTGGDPNTVDLRPL
jgi:outer membrane protein OmpA-like peptidoglycan-associated protein/opacity protein-like surface antigen